MSTFDFNRRKQEERAKKKAEGVPAHVLAEQRAKSRAFIEEHNARQAARRAGESFNKGKFHRDENFHQC